MSENNINCYDFDVYRLDVRNLQLLENGESVALTQKSFELLHFLVENRGRILKKEELLSALWEGNFVEEANLTQHIYMLRKVLKQKDKKKIFIETIPKNGYRFLGDVSEIYEEPIHISKNGNFSNFDQSPDFFTEGSEKFLADPTENYSDFAKERTAGKENAFGQIRSAKMLAVIGALGIILFSTALYFFVGFEEIFPGQKPKSYAVLPFKQINGEKDDKLGIGVADVLIARLANIEEITVSPTTSILRFANQDNSDLSEAGTKLGVDWIISGTIQRENDNIRVTTQLYSVQEKRQIWTETMDEKYSDIFTLQDKISEKVAQKVSAGLNNSSSDLPYKQYTKNIEAYQAYSMGLSFWTMHSRAGFEKAIGEFKKAIERDPHFTLAYAYLADTYGHTEHISHLMSKEEARRKGVEAAKDALELDPNCAEAMSALALIYAGQNRQTEAFGLMHRAVELKPNDAHARHRISWMYANKGDIERSVLEMRRAQKLDPQSSYINMFLGETLLYSQQPDEAIKFINKALEIDPNSSDARWYLVKAFEQKGQYDLAEKELKRLMTENKESGSLSLVLSRIYAKSGKKQQSRRILNKVVTKGETESEAFLLAQALIAHGEEDKAVKILQKVIDSIEDNIYIIKYEPNLEPLKNNRQFLKLLKEKEQIQGW